MVILKNSNSNSKGHVTNLQRDLYRGESWPSTGYRAAMDTNPVCSYTARGARSTLAIYFCNRMSFSNDYWMMFELGTIIPTTCTRYHNRYKTCTRVEVKAIVFRFEYWFLGPGCTRLGTRSWALSSSMQASSQLTNSHKSHLLMIFCFGGRLEKSDMNS